MKQSRIDVNRESKVGQLDYILLFLCILVAYLAERVFELSSVDMLIERLMLAATIGIILAWYIGYKSGKYSLSIAQCIIAIGCIIRIGYMLYTDCTERAYDVYGLTKDSIGHDSYLLYIIEDGHLPPTNDGQFYQQPFSYLCGGLLSKIVNGLLQCKDEKYLVDTARVVSCFASCATLYLVHPFLKMCNVKKNGVCIGLAIVSFTPALIMAGGRVSCDAMVTLFMLLEVMYTIKWYRETTWKNTILLAIIYGLGVLTKVSCGIFAIFTIAVFIYKIVRIVSKKEPYTLKEILCKLVAFGCISLPLGLWYCVRNAILFSQPFAYVLRIPENNTLYTGYVPFFKRLFYIDWNNLISSPFPAVREDYNAPAYYLKSSLFGEFVLDIPHVLAVLLVSSAIVVAIVIFGVIIRQFFKKNTSRISFVICSLFCMYYLSMLWFYIEYPMGCSMDYRYMMILTPFAAVLLGDYCEHGKRKLYLLSTVMVAIYSVLSITMFLFLR